MARFFVLVVLVLVGTPLAWTQTFDAVSIRATGQSAGRGSLATQPGRVIADGSTLKEIVAVAYGLPQDRVLGGPDWAGSTRFSITATTAGEAGRERAQRMLQAMLGDRFGLTLHREQRELPVYLLTLARRDGSFGPGLRRAGAACAPMTPPKFDDLGVPPPPPPPPPPPGGSSMRPLLERETTLRCPTMFFPGGVSARAIVFDEFVYRLSRFAARPIVDRTGLGGEFDIDLFYQFELSSSAPGGPAVGGPGPGVAAPAGSGPSLFSAVQDQLGLRLEGGRAPIDVVVIDSARPPSEN